MDEKRIFGYFESLMNGFEISPSCSDDEFLFEAASFLWNTELASQVAENEGALNATNVLNRIERKAFAGVDFESEVEWAASHFYALELEAVKRMDMSIVEGIVSSGCLRLDTEDSLVDVILGFGFEGVILFGYVHSEYLSIGRVCAVLDGDWGTDLDGLVWSSLCRRLSFQCWGKRSDGLVSVEVKMKESGSLEGIISYLTTKHGGNVDEKGIVVITSKSVSDGSAAVRNAVDLTSDSFFLSQDAPGQWICWDFGELRIRLTAYTIKTWSMTSWIFEG
jgi:hypothetical protein